MSCDGNNKRGLHTAGGVLSMVAGVFLISGAVLIAVVLLGPIYGDVHFSGSMPVDVLLWFLPFVPYFAEVWWQFFDVGTALAIVAGCVGALGIVALIGGMLCIRRRSFGLSLAGAICAIPSLPLGILAVIFVALGKREFKVKETDAEVVV